LPYHVNRFAWKTTFFRKMLFMSNSLHRHPQNGLCAPEDGCSTVT
jgi:hypothetical protein